MVVASKPPQQSPRRRAVAIAAVAGVAAIHLLPVGSYLEGTAHRLYHGYASDIVIPFAMYFVMLLGERTTAAFGDWRVKALLVLAAACGAEVLQGLGVPALGSTFDPLDFLMYALGVLAAVLVDRAASPAAAAAPRSSSQEACP
jgi:hypothetical protein